MARHESVKGLPVVMVADGKQVDNVDENHNGKHEHDKHESKGAWFGLRIGVLIGGLAGTLFGGLVGSLAMLLLAPHSGKKTRAKLLRRGQELREQAAESAEDAMDEAGVKAHQMTHDAGRRAKKLERRGHAMLAGHNGR